MSETLTKDRYVSDSPEAAVRRRRGISIVWLIPIVAALIGGFLAYRAYTEKGPTITLSFATADGLEAGKTKLRYLDVEVGTVQTVAIAPDLKHIVVTAGMVPGAESYLREQTAFWIVRPRIGVGGVSGLGTLLSGAYIGLAPGEGAPQRSFTGLEQPPPIDANVAGRRYTLTAASLGSLSRGAPIFYRGLDIGQILDHQLAPDARSLQISIFVRAPYDDLVRTTSRFWNASGVNVATTTSGIDVQVASLQSLIIGGIEFDNPLDNSADQVADAGATFPLFPNRSALARAQFTQKIPFLVYFDGSVRGLDPGAPVEFRGVTVGEVSSVSLDYDRATNKIRIPVRVDIEPQRLVPGGFTAAEIATTEHRGMAELVRRGLRAQLQTGNLLTGELFVDLTFAAGAPPAELDTSGLVPVLPSVPATIEALQASVSAILNKVAALPVEQLVGSLAKTAAGLEAIVNAPDIQEAAKSLGGTLAQMQRLVGRIDAGADPLLGGVTAAAVSADAALRQAQATIASVQRTVGAGSALTGDAENVMQELTRAARSIRVFADYLDRHPEALLRGKAGGASR
jgi:paraquat-inducible protein B